MRRTALFAGFGALLLLLAWWFFFISPRNASIDEARRDLTAAQDEESRLRGQVAQLQDILDNEVEYLAGIGKMETLIPDRPRLEEFIEQINDLALATGVDLETLSPSVPAPSEDGSALREITVTTNFTGRFFDVMGFLFGLSDMERLVKVDGISLASETDEAGNTVLSVSVELKLFTLADLLPTVDDPAGDPATGETTDTTVPGEEA